MGTILNKLWSSKGTVLIIFWVMVFAWVYTLDYTKKPIIHNPIPAGKTIEEIIASPVEQTPVAAWDTDFKSSIEALE